MNIIINWLNNIIKSKKLFSYKFFGFNKNKKIYKLNDYKKILNKIIDDKNIIKNNFSFNLFLQLYLKKVFNNNEKNPTYIIINNNNDIRKEKRIIHNRKRYIYYTKILNEKSEIIRIYTKEDKNYYLKEIKKYYPYYTYLNKYTKQQLKDIYNKICINKNKIKNENNSCYIDSFIFSLFNTKNKIIEKLLLNASINNYNSYLYQKGLEIQNELKRIYNQINDNDNDNEINDIYICKNLRKLFQDYYNSYRNTFIKSKLYMIDFISSQNDYYEIINVLNIIFKIPNVLEYSINDNIEKRSFVDLFPIDYLLENDKIEIKNYYPKRINKIFIDNNSKPLKVENIQYLTSPILFIHFNRNFLDTHKINIPIIPSLKIKMKNNKLNLYLNSIIIHYGNVKYGHYITLYECKGIWYKFDDMNNDRILIGSFDEIIKNDNYIRNIVGLYYF